MAGVRSMPVTCRATRAKAAATSPGPQATSRTMSAGPTPLAVTSRRSASSSRMPGAVENGTACRVNWSRIACRLSGSAMLAARLDGRPDVVADEPDDVLGGGAGSEQLLHPDRLQGLDVVLGDDAPAEQRDVVRAPLLQELQDPPEQIVVGAGEHGEA